MATGPITKAEDHLVETLANCARFQTLVGALNATEAKASIHTDALTEPASDGIYTQAELEALHPYALVATDGDAGYYMEFSSMSAVGGHEYADGGRIVLALARIAPGVSITADERGWKEIVGEIIAQLFVLAGGAGYLAITAIRLVALDRFHPDDQVDMADAQGARLAVEWGAD
jgi:hypothetical protein